MLQFFDHGRETFTPTRPIPACRWDRFDLLAVHQGTLRLEFEQTRELTLGKGSAVVIYPQTRFSGAPETEACRVSVQHFRFNRGLRAAVAPAPLRRLVGRKTGFEPLRMRERSVVERDIDRAMQLAFEEQTDWVHDSRVALLTLIFSRLDPLGALTLPRDARDWDSLDAWLRTQLHRPITVAHMAQQMDLSTGHFTTHFRRRTGTSPAKHLYQLRMQEARRLLRETRQPIKAIAEQLAYEELPNFYRAFRKTTGDTPAAYRNRYRLRG